MMLLFWFINELNGYILFNCGFLMVVFYVKMGDYICVCVEKFICEFNNGM